MGLCVTAPQGCLAWFGNRAGRVGGTHHLRSVFRSEPGEGTTSVNFDRSELLNPATRL
jgi:hypothetical protein